jgi:hypothetical protein
MNGNIVTSKATVIFSRMTLLQAVHYVFIIKALSPRIKRLEREADHSPPSAPRLKISRTMLPLTNTSSRNDA